MRTQLNGLQGGQSGGGGGKVKLAAVREVISCGRARDMVALGKGERD